MIIHNKKDMGYLGEQVATEYLEKNNYKILDRNFYCRQGEIDIIAKDKKEIVFIEVKTRTNYNFGKPSEAINNIKQKHLYKTARYFLYKNNLLNCLIRFDAIEVLILNGKIKINHLKQIM
jgi:putative endonuclease